MIYTNLSFFVCFVFVFVKKRRIIQVVFRFSNGIGFSILNIRIGHTIIIDVVSFRSGR